MHKFISKQINTRESYAKKKPIKNYLSFIMSQGKKKQKKTKL